MSELVRRAGVVCLVALVFLRCALAGLTVGRDTPRRSQAPRPRGLELRTIKRIGPRIVALRFQLVIA